MHSMPPLVTISSSSAGARPCVEATRERRYSRTLGSPSLGPYCSATPGSSASTRAAISDRTSVWKVVTFGNPPVIPSTPGGGPARIVASSALPRLRARRANSSFHSIGSQFAGGGNEFTPGAMSQIRGEDEYVPTEADHLVHSSGPESFPPLTLAGPSAGPPRLTSAAAQPSSSHARATAEDPPPLFSGRARHLRAGAGRHHRGQGRRRQYVFRGWTLVNATLLRSGAAQGKDLPTLRRATALTASAKKRSAGPRERPRR